MAPPRPVLSLLTCAALCVLALGCAHTSASLKPGEYQRVLNGVRLYYRVAGADSSRPPVVFLHGGPGYNSHSFATLAGPRLERTQRMVYLDQRGCGHSERPASGDYALSTLVADLEALRQTLGVERWTLMGHSFGGMLALEYAARHPEHVASLVLVGPASDLPASTAIWARELEKQHPGRLAATAHAEDTSDFARVMRALGGLDAQHFFNSLQFREERFRVLQDEVDAKSGLRNTGEQARALMAAGLPEYRFTAFERITAPVLVIGGRYDFSIGVEPMRELARSLPRATFLEYEASGHFPYLEEAERFERDVARFLDTVGQAASGY